MARYLDIERWERRHHFEFFRGYDLPFFSLCAEVDVTAAVELSRRAESPSFLLTSLHASLRAANQVEPFRYRLRGDRVLVHEVTHGGSTLLLDDETFRFGYFDFHQDLATFARRGQAEIERVRAGSGLRAKPERDDLIHYSVIPWVRFTSFSHARRLDADDSVPKIVFGKYAQEGGRYRMPVSVEVHHSLMDGLHVGRFFALFQSQLDAYEADVGDVERDPKGEVGQQ